MSKDRSTLELVEEFHRAFNIPIPEEPEIPALSPIARRKLEQLAHAMKQAATMALIFAQNLRGTTSGLAFTRLQLMQEELYEVAGALLEGELHRVLHEMADLQYVVDGGFLDFGFDHLKGAAVSTIHAANMTKLGPDGKPILNPAGRVVKGPNFKPADLSTLFPETKD